MKMKKEIFDLSGDESSIKSTIRRMPSHAFNDLFFPKIGPNFPVNRNVILYKIGLENDKAAKMLENLCKNNTVIKDPSLIGPHMEEWRDIEGFENRYMISNYGRVKSLDRYVNNSLTKSGKCLLRGKIMPGHINQDGYNRITLSRNNKRKMIFAHVLVARAFIPNPNNLPEVNHKSGFKTENCFSNLEWTDRSGNLKHAYDSGLRVSSKKGKLWSNHPNSRKVVQINPITNEVIRIHKSLREANYRTGADESSIIRVCQGKQKTSMKFKWRYFNE